MTGTFSAGRPGAGAFQVIPAVESADTITVETRVIGIVTAPRRWFCLLLVVCGASGCDWSVDPMVYCLLSAIPQVDKEPGALHEVQCEAERESWLIATREAPEPVALEALGVPPLAASVVAADRDEHRCNWHVFPMQADSGDVKTGKGMWPCEKLPLDVSSLMAVRATRFRVILARDRNGGVHLVRLMAIQ